MSIPQTIPATGGSDGLPGSRVTSRLSRSTTSGHHCMVLTGFNWGLFRARPARTLRPVWRALVRLLGRLAGQYAAYEIRYRGSGSFRRTRGAENLA